MPYLASSPRRRHARFSPSRAAKSIALNTLALLGAGAHADPSIALDRVSIAAGAFDAERNVKADLLLGDAQGISLDYHRFDKSYDTSLSGSTVRNGQQLTGSGTANAKLQLDLAQLAYTFWIGQGSDVVGVGLGAGY